jgi:Tfp pilus assembly pilus retraction ATPase PilT
VCACATKDGMGGMIKVSCKVTLSDFRVTSCKRRWCNPKANKAKCKEKERYVQFSFRSNGRGTFKIKYFVARRNKSMAIKSISSKALEVCSNTASPICRRMKFKSTTFYFWIDVITCNCALIVFGYAIIDSLRTALLIEQMMEF